MSLLLATSHQADAYQTGIYFGRPVLRSSTPFSSMIQKQQAMMDQMLGQQATIDQVFKEFDRCFDNPRSSSCRPGVQGGNAAAVTRRSSSLSSPYHITNNDEIFSISMDVPGVDPSNIDVSIVEDVLTVSGRRDSSTGSTTGGGVSDDQASSSSYKFKKSFSIDSSSVNVEQFSASLENGVLSVSAPKHAKKEEVVTKIPVQVVNTRNEEEGITAAAGDDEVETGQEQTPASTSTATAGEPEEEEEIDLDAASPEAPPEDA